MSLVDVAIVVLLLLSMAIGFQSGFIRSVTSLLGLVAGIAYASWNYKMFAERLMPYVSGERLADAIAFGLVALLVMIIFGLVGMVIKKIVHGVGLGFFDRLFGLVFGFLQGALLVTLCLVTMIAFFPAAKWLDETQLSKYFLGPVHLTVQITPHDLKQRIMGGLHTLQRDSPAWLHPE